MSREFSSNISERLGLLESKYETLKRENAELQNEMRIISRDDHLSTKEYLRTLPFEFETVTDAAGQKLIKGAPKVEIKIYNSSSNVSVKELDTFLEFMKMSLSDPQYGFLKLWNLDLKVELTRGKARLPTLEFMKTRKANQWPIFLYDGADSVLKKEIELGALKDFDFPLPYAIVRTDVDKFILNDPLSTKERTNSSCVSASLSRAIYQLLANPLKTEMVRRRLDNTWFPVKVCDPVSSTAILWNGADKTTGEAVTLANYILPEWANESGTTGFDFGNYLSKPFTVAPKSSINRYDKNFKMSVLSLGQEKSSRIETLSVVRPRLHTLHQYMKSVVLNKYTVLHEAKTDFCKKDDAKPSFDRAREVYDQMRKSQLGDGLSPSSPKPKTRDIEIDLREDGSLRSTQYERRGGYTRKP